MQTKDQSEAEIREWARKHGPTIVLELRRLKKSGDIVNDQEAANVLETLIDQRIDELSADALRALALNSLMESMAECIANCVNVLPLLDLIDKIKEKDPRVEADKPSGGFSE